MTANEFCEWLNGYLDAIEIKHKLTSKDSKSDLTSKDISFNHEFFQKIRDQLDKIEKKTVQHLVQEYLYKIIKEENHRHHYHPYPYQIPNGIGVYPPMQSQCPPINCTNGTNVIDFKANAL